MLMYEIITNLQLSIFENTQYMNIHICIFMDGEITTFLHNLSCFFPFYLSNDSHAGIEKKIDNINKDIQKLFSF